MQGDVRVERRVAKRLAAGEAVSVPLAPERVTGDAVRVTDGVLFGSAWFPEPLWCRVADIDTAAGTMTLERSA